MNQEIYTPRKEETRVEVAEYYAAGHKASETGKKFGISAGTVLSILRRLGFAIRHPGGFRPRKAVKKPVESKGLTPICRYFQCSQPLNPRRRKDSRYCSPSCRVRACNERKRVALVNAALVNQESKPLEKA